MIKLKHKQIKVKENQNLCITHQPDCLFMGFQKLLMQYIFLKGRKHD